MFSLLSVATTGRLFAALKSSGTETKVLAVLLTSPNAVRLVAILSPPAVVEANVLSTPCAVCGRTIRFSFPGAGMALGRCGCRNSKSATEINPGWEHDSGNDIQVGNIVSVWEPEVGLTYLCIHPHGGKSGGRWLA